MHKRHACNVARHGSTIVNYKHSVLCAIRRHEIADDPCSQSHVCGTTANDEKGTYDKAEQPPA